MHFAQVSCCLLGVISSGSRRRHFHRASLIGGVHVALDQRLRRGAPGSYCMQTEKIKTFTEELIIWRRLPNTSIHQIPIQYMQRRMLRVEILLVNIIALGSAPRKTP
jgi:hypothetical protein